MADRTSSKTSSRARAGLIAAVAAGMLASTLVGCGGTNVADTREPFEVRPEAYDATSGRLEFGGIQRNSVLIAIDVADVSVIEDTRDRYPSLEYRFESEEDAAYYGISSTRRDDGTLVIGLGALPDVEEEDKPLLPPSRVTIELRTQEADSVEVALERGDITVKGLGNSRRVRASDGRSSRLETGSGEINVEDLSGPVKVLSGRGDVSIRGGAGEVRLNSRLGNVLVSGRAGPVTIAAGDGEVRLDDVQDTFDIEVGRGDAVVIPTADWTGRIQITQQGTRLEDVALGSSRTLSTVETSNGVVTIESP